MRISWTRHPASSAMACLGTRPEEAELAPVTLEEMNLGLDPLMARALAARPEAGDLAARWEYFSTLLATSRVDWAFAVDACLYSVWQAWLLGAAGAAPAYRFVPFFGMAAWLVAGPRGAGRCGSSAAGTGVEAEEAGWLLLP